MTADRIEMTRVIRDVTDAWEEPLDEVHDVPPIVNAVLAYLAEHDRPDVPAAGLRVTREEWGWDLGDLDPSFAVSTGSEAYARHEVGRFPRERRLMHRGVTTWTVVDGEATS
jgi:hypothetical protein